MQAYADTEPQDFDGAEPLTREEREHVRRLLRDDDRATWARKRLMVIVPLLVGLVTGIYQLWAWILGHVKVTP